MVEWKGEVTREESGGKAARLDSVESLNVPNFFTITRTDVRELIGEADSSEEVVNKQFSGSTWKKVEKAYDEIGMSSEVREASGKARNLVGGQRNGQRVSLRVSDDREGVFDYRLNVGASGLEDALKEVIASYYQVETEQDYPAVIVQQMVEPGYSGAAITSYFGNYSLLETVEGLGASIEEGVTTPAMYLVGNRVEERRIPEKQVAVERNNMNGKHEKKTVRPEPPFSDEEVIQLFQSLEQENVDVKFVYKRGSFYVVDASETGHVNPFGTTSLSLEGIRVSEGEIEGEIGREIAYSEETVSPDKYPEAVISKKGGYTSTHAQLARSREKPAVFSFREELEQGQHVSLEPRQVTVTGETNEPEDLHGKVAGTASEVLPIDSGNGIYMTPPFSRSRYAVTDRNARADTIPSSGYLTSYGEIFGFEGEKAVLDARKLGREGLEEAITYLDADLKILLVDYPEPEIIRAAVSAGFDVFGTSRNLEQLEKVVEREERRFILKQLRELSK